MRGLRECTLGLAAAAVIGLAASSALAALANPGFESPDASAGDIFATSANSGWFGFNAAFITRSTHHNGLQSLKTFGAPGGAFQDFDTTPGTPWTGTVFGENLSTDPMTGSQAGFINIEWHSGTAANPGPLISFVSTKVVDSTSPFDTWIQGTVTDTAPAGGTVARIVLLSGPFNGSGNGGGATFFDDATFSAVPEPASMAVLGLGALSLTARRRRQR
jgi:hypothetical protein